MVRLLLATITALALVGCKNQSATTISNPFLTPDRVPPPPTRVLTPGTAQPYYPGDPAPSLNAFPPPAGTQAPAFTPGAAYPPATTAPTYPPPATGGAATPPGGWGTYPQTAPQPQYTPTPTAPTYAPPGQTPYNAVPSGYTPTYQVTPTSAELKVIEPQGQAIPLASQPRLPIERMLGTREPVVAPVGTTLAATQPTTASWSDPAFQQATFSPGTATLSAGPTTGGDGFRPRGANSSDNATTAFQPPAITRAGLESSPAGDARYSVADDYGTLRGQLVLDGQSGMMFIHYMIAGADPYGGVLPLANPEVVAGLMPGEYVKLTGQIFTTPRDDGTQMPVYRVSAVERQAK